MAELIRDVYSWRMLHTHANTNILRSEEGGWLLRDTDVSIPGLVLPRVH